jgi:hypothetical protein
MAKLVRAAGDLSDQGPLVCCGLEPARVVQPLSLRASRGCQPDHPPQPQGLLSPVLSVFATPERRLSGRTDVSFNTTASISTHSDSTVSRGSNLRVANHSTGKSSLPRRVHFAVGGPSKVVIFVVNSNQIRRRPRRSRDISHLDYRSNVMAEQATRKQGHLLEAADVVVSTIGAA